MDIPPPQPHVAPAPGLPSALHLQSTLEALGRAPAAAAAAAAGDGVSLPAPQQFDFVPPLHALVARVHNDELDPKDLSHQANPIRVKVAKARQLVAELPDIARGIAAQQDEIRALEHRLNMQRRVIADALAVVRAQMCRSMPTASASSAADASAGVAGKSWGESMTIGMHLDD